jgi:hypothetical protein
MFRCLALGHLGWGTLLLLGATWWSLSAFRILPYMSSGSSWASLWGTALLLTSSALPVAVLGVWMVILGRRLWSGHPQLRNTLLATHGILLVPGFLAVAVGIYAVRAAERSTAEGGGLLGPVAALPLAFGLPVVVLALCSIVVALAVIPGYQADSR